MPRRRHGTERPKLRSKAKKNERTIAMMNNFFNNTCQYCMINEADTLDHIIPRAASGDNRLSNLIPACRACNEKKGDTVPPEKELEDLKHRVRMCLGYIQKVRARHKHFTKRRNLKLHGRYDLLEDYRMVTDEPRINHSC